MWLPGADGTRLEDQLQQITALRSHDRVESPDPVDGERVWDQDLDPWAAGFEPWPAPTLGEVSNPISNVGGLQVSASGPSNQIPRNSDK